MLLVLEIDQIQIHPVLRYKISFFYVSAIKQFSSSNIKFQYQHQKHRDEVVFRKICTNGIPVNTHIIDPFDYLLMIFEVATILRALLI